MTFAIIETGGKQYKVSEGSVLKTEKLPVPTKGNTIEFDKVLLIDDGKSTVVGDPYIKGAKITADFIEEGKGKKVTGVKFKNKTGYRKAIGHRQPYTKVAIKAVK